jgi:Tfp pilus assembly protein PilO
MNKEMRTTAITAVLIVIGALVLGYFVNETLTEIEAVSASERRARGARSPRSNAKVNTMPALQVELENLKANFAQYIKILPSPEIATTERLIELVQEKCERSAFQLKSFNYKPGNKAVQGGARGGFREIDITLSAEGSYEQFLRFLNGLERHESFVRVNSFTCTVAEHRQEGRRGQGHLAAHGGAQHLHLPLRLGWEVAMTKHTRQERQSAALLVSSGALGVSGARRRPPRPRSGRRPTRPLPPARRRRREHERVHAQDAVHRGHRGLAKWREAVETFVRLRTAHPGVLADKRLRFMHARALYEAKEVASVRDRARGPPRDAGQPHRGPVPPGPASAPRARTRRTRTRPATCSSRRRAPASSCSATSARRRSSTSCSRTRASSCA